MEQAGRQGQESLKNNSPTARKGLEFPIKKEANRPKGIRVFGKHGANRSKRDGRIVSTGETKANPSKGTRDVEKHGANRSKGTSVCCEKQGAIRSKGAKKLSDRSKRPRLF